MIIGIVIVALAAIAVSIALWCRWRSDRLRDMAFMDNNFPKTWADLVAGDSFCQCTADQPVSIDATKERTA